MNSMDAIKSWENEGKYFSFKGNNIFYIDLGTKTNDTLSILHGYPSCSFDYKNVLPVLSKYFRVVIIDFLGFGLSDKPSDDEYLLTTQADIAVACWQYLEIGKLHLVAHNYGTSVATELIYRDNMGTLDFQIKSVTLCNGSMLIDMSQLRPIQKLLKNPFSGPFIAMLSNKNTFHRNMRNIWYDRAKYNKGEMQPIWDMLCMNKGKKVLPRITRYINQRFENYDRWIGALQDTTLPVHIIWAENDPVAVIAMADKLQHIISNSTKSTIPQCGHYPMIEKEKLWASLVIDWIRNH